jgi:hypothetical protein
MEDSSPSSLGIRRRNETTIPPSSHPLSAQTASRTSVSNSSTYNPSQPLSHPSNHPSSAIAAVGSLPSFPLTPLKRRKVIRDLSSMDIEAQVGAGMYGCVYKAVDRLKGDKVALKYIKMAKESQGFPVTAIREIKLLKAMNNENIIRLHDVITFSKPETSGGSDTLLSLRSSLFSVMAMNRFQRRACQSSIRRWRSLYGVRIHGL